MNLSATDVIEGMEASDHDMNCEDWAAFLLIIAPQTYDEPPPPECFCVAEPGTEGKIQIMAERHERGEHIHSQTDLQIDSNQRAARETHRARNGRDEHGALRAFELQRDRDEVLEEIKRQEVEEALEQARKGRAA